jgi:hypothetical protein
MTIIGLRFEEKLGDISLPNGFEIGTAKPFYLVYHGKKPFSYPHYGVHLGQEDRLTFIGDLKQPIEGLFVDCRLNSPSWGERQTIQFHPDVHQTLIIPPGVGHAFRGLEDVFTINDYHLFLPQLENLLSGNTQWTPEADVLNINLDDAKTPTLSVNTEIASDLYYNALSYHYKTQLSNGRRQYPIVRQITIEGRDKLVRFTPRINNIAQPMPTVGNWQAHVTVDSGDESGVILFDRSRTIVVTAPISLSLCQAMINANILGITILSTDKRKYINFNGQEILPNVVFELIVKSSDQLNIEDDFSGFIIRGYPDDRVQT